MWSRFHTATASTVELSVVDIFDWYSGWNRIPVSICYVAEKVNLTHGMCGVGEHVEE